MRCLKSYLKLFAQTGRRLGDNSHRAIQYIVINGKKANRSTILMFIPAKLPSLCFSFPAPTQDFQHYYMKESVLIFFLVLNEEVYPTTKLK